MEGFFDDLVDRFKKNGRIEEMRQIAHANNFKFKNRDNFANQDYLLKSFSIFNGKKDKRLKGIMMKEELAFNADLRVYDYWYFGDFKKRKTTIFEIKCAEFDFPKFEIRTKGLLNKMSELVLSKDKVFPDATEFHTTYEIVTDTPEELETELNLQSLDFILDKKNMFVEGDGDYLLVYFLYSQIPAREIMEEYEDVLEFVDVIFKNDEGEFV
ncbi:MAG: hypothetical protein AB8H03_15350 [Saprospiraceae bacterium]